MSYDDIVAFYKNFSYPINFDSKPYTNKRVLRRKDYFKIIEDHPEVKEELTAALVEAHEKWMEQLKKEPDTWS